MVAESVRNFSNPVGAEMVKQISLAAHFADRLAEVVEGGVLGVPLFLLVLGWWSSSSPAELAAVSVVNDNSELGCFARGAGRIVLP